MNDRDLIARTLARVHNQSDTPVSADVLDSWHPYADAVLDAIEDRILPDMPNDVERVTIDCDNGWQVEFWYTDYQREEPEWVDMSGDYMPSKFALASQVCEIIGADEWVCWDCYTHEDEWIVFGGEDELDTPPIGTGPTIPAAIRDALGEGA